ncbi:MAG: AgmX/PglI C-terminal domain-containing protein [Deltaproteobacteria bacterium]|nr:AgmX/PglI C-terminal domain-containing protein [Deltaproteobacteria bacterium]
MRDTSPPPNRSGSNKAIVFLLLGGLTILAAAGVVLYKRRAEPPKPPPEPPKVAEKIDVPAPLVVSQPTRPALNDKKEDAGASEEKKVKGPKKKRTRRSGPAGSIDTKAVNRYMNSHFAEVKACYEHQLKKNSFLEGKLDLNIDVSLAGKVTRVSVNKDTVRNAAMLACVKRTIRRWSLPKPTGGHVIIAKTFNFKKKS